MLLIAGIAATVFSIAGKCDRHEIVSQREATEMNWDRIEDNWKRIRGNVIEQWDDINGDQSASQIREAYGISDDDAGSELTEWQQRLREIGRGAQ